MLYLVTLDGRIDSRHETNGEAREAIEEMVNFQDIEPERIACLKDGNKLMLDFRRVYSVSVGGQ